MQFEGPPSRSRLPSTSIENMPHRLRSGRIPMCERVDAISSCPSCACALASTSSEQIRGRVVVALGSFRSRFGVEVGPMRSGTWIGATREFACTRAAEAQIVSKNNLRARIRMVKDAIGVACRDGSDDNTPKVRRLRHNVGISGDALKRSGRPSRATWEAGPSLQLCGGG